jgi:trk system potassium uptake protein TrkA
MAMNKKDICVIGMGRFGLSIVKQLIELKKQVFAIDTEEKSLVRPSRLTNTAILDASDVEGLKALGIDTFNTVIVAVSENIEIVASLKEIGVKHIIAKAISDAHERVLNQIGVDVIVKPEVEAGVRTALIATNTNFIKYSKLLQEIGDGYAIGSTKVNDVS